MILHLDGDAFFASCEVSLHPEYRGKPLVVGGERGIITALTYEAKARGLSRGLPMHIARRLCPEVVVVKGDFRSYGLISSRMFRIVRRYADVVQEYSIDECFAHIPHEEQGIDAVMITLDRLRHDLLRELGVTFSLGFAPTKVLAKVASKHQKPFGLTCILPDQIKDFLEDFPLEKVWGIGSATSENLRKKGLHTAGQFISFSEKYVQESFSKPLQEIWYELNGVSIYKIHNGSREKHKSIAKTATFSSGATSDQVFLFSQLSKNIERACFKARRLRLAAKEISFFLKTSEFRYHTMQVILPQPTSSAKEIMRAVEKNFGQIYQPHILYRASGITLRSLSDSECLPYDLFGEGERLRDEEAVHVVADKLSAKFGTNAVFLASSLFGFQKRNKKIFNQRSGKSLWKKIDPYLRLPFLYLGEIF